MKNKRQKLVFKDSEPDIFNKSFKSYWISVMCKWWSCTIWKICIKHLSFSLFRFIRIFKYKVMKLGCICQFCITFKWKVPFLDNLYTCHIFWHFFSANLARYKGLVYAISISWVASTCAKAFKKLGHWAFEIFSEILILLHAIIVKNTVVFSEWKPK